MSALAASVRLFKRRFGQMTTRPLLSSKLCYVGFSAGRVELSTLSCWGYTRLLGENLVGSRPSQYRRDWPCQLSSPFPRWPLPPTGLLGPPNAQYISRVHSAVRLYKPIFPSIPPATTAQPSDSQPRLTPGLGLVGKPSPEDTHENDILCSI
jgi:hypothetical protein